MMMVRRATMSAARRAIVVYFALLAAACSANKAGDRGDLASGSGGAGAGLTGNAAGSGGTPACPGTVRAANPSGTAHGTPGIWVNVSPGQLNFTPSAYNNDNFGVQDVLVDPARPSDLYAFVCHQGVWKSVDYGETWTKVNTGKNGDVIDSGKPWGSGIDSDRCRDPNTPPALYTLNGNGQQGFWKSIDGGVSWSRTALPDQPSLQYDQDAYSIAVDPHDGQHLIMGFHEAAGLVESTDGGMTWAARTVGDSGVSVYANFVDTGDAASTRTTWLTIGQSGSMQRTANGGSTWTKVETLQHAHGCSQIFQAGRGVIYAPGSGGSQGDGIYRSADYGVTWSKVSAGSENGVVGTRSTLYASYAWANAGGLDPALKTAPRDAGMTWSNVPTPSGMTNGWKGAAVTSDGTHEIIVSGHWNAGIWRYIEP
jgi:hypothetical protein